LSLGDPPALETAAWQLDSSPPHLPTTLVYSVGNAADADSPSSQRPFTNVIYEAVSFADFQGLRVPEESVVSIYRLIGPGNPTNQLCQQMRVLATNMISGVTLKSFRPKLPGRTALSEQRFNNGSGLQFAYFTEKDWPSEPVSRNSEAYKEAKAMLAGDLGIFLPIGTNAPDISLRWLSGTEQKRLSDYKGKVMVLEFWGTWCPPCQTTIDELQTYVKKYPAWRNKVALITLNLNEDQEDAASQAQRKGWNKTDNFWVNNGDALKTFSFSGIPMIYIINQRGEIAAAGHDLDIPKNVNRLLRESGQ
jgi:thiol-disulfide isomerase/thioredoxin